MKTINLINGEGFKIITFPDGEKHLKVDPIDLKQPINIICRITNSDELFILMQLSDILNRLEVSVDKIEITYLMSMRCDRLFSMEEPFTLKLVANVIKSFNAKAVYIIEPHSSRSLDLINNSVAVNPMDELVKQMAETHTICYPDKGASDRYDFECDSRIYCKKVRTVETGKLIKFSIDRTISDTTPANIVIVDDLCDGGGTFLGIAELLRKEFNPSKLVLVVTHAVQEDGIKRVAKVFDEVHITDSYRNWSEWDELPDNVKVKSIE